MRPEVFKLRSRTLLGFVAGTVVIFSVVGCWKKSGKALVLEKEHIAAAEITPTPATQQSVSPSAITADSDEPTPQDEKPRELGKDEIVVDTYVMKKDVRGTSRDPRAISDEQWIVKVQMIDDLRQIDVRTDKLHWDKVKIGDRINVSYREGKYTGTVWAADIE